MNNKIPFWEKYKLTIREVADISILGRKKMRRIAEENIYSDFVVMNGNRVMIKRKSFEQYIDQATAV